MSLGSLVIIALAVALLVAGALLVRSRNPHPWSAIVVSMLTSAVAYTVGGGSAKDASGPSIATITASVAGFLAVVAAIMALVPRSGDAPASRVPMYVAVIGILVGAVGLVLNQLVD